MPELEDVISQRVDDLFVLVGDRGAPPRCMFQPKQTLGLFAADKEHLSSYINIIKLACVFYSHGYAGSMIFYGSDISTAAIFNRLSSKSPLTSIHKYCATSPSGVTLHFESSFNRKYSKGLSNSSHDLNILALNTKTANKSHQNRSSLFIATNIPSFTLLINHI
jgi:hypothetical protein